MKLYGYSPGFEGLVDPKLIQRGDIDPPKFLMRLPHEEYFEWKHCGWSTVICVSNLEEAEAILAKIQEVYAVSGSGTGT